MANTQSYTNLEQSKKLMELGIDINTADIWWAERYEGRVTEDGQYIVAKEPYYYLSLTKPSDTNYSQDTIKDIPAWSLSALLGLMPKELEDDLDLCYGTFDDNGEYQPLWTCSCMNHIDFGDTSVDAVFKVVCWLLENKKL